MLLVQNHIGLHSFSAAAVINEGTPGRKEPYTERETVWIGGSPNQWRQITTGMPDDLIQINQSAVIRLTPRSSPLSEP